MNEISVTAIILNLRRPEKMGFSRQKTVTVAKKNNPSAYLSYEWKCEFNISRLAPLCLKAGFRYVQALSNEVTLSAGNPYRFSATHGAEFSLTCLHLLVWR